MSAHAARRRAALLLASVGVAAGVVVGCEPSRSAHDARVAADRAADASPPRSEDAGAIAVLAAPKDGGGAAPPVVVEAPGPCARLGWSTACTPRHKLQDSGPSVDIAAWYAARSATPPHDDIVQSCLPLRIGPDAEEALACELLEHVGLGDPARGPHAYRVLVRTVVRAVRKKRVEVVFDVPVLVDLLDKDEPSGPLFMLAVDTSQASTEIKVAEPGPNACADAAKSLSEVLKEAAKEKDRASRAALEIWPRFDARLLGRLCAATGRYVWSKGVFVRAAAAPPGVSPQSGSGASSL